MKGKILGFSILIKFRKGATKTWDSITWERYPWVAASTSESQQRAPAGLGLRLYEGHDVQVMMPFQSLKEGIGAWTFENDMMSCVTIILYVNLAGPLIFGQILSGCFWELFVHSMPVPPSYYGSNNLSDFTSLQLERNFASGMNHILSLPTFHLDDIKWNFWLQN